jgi:IS30 family transposase
MGQEDNSTKKVKWKQISYETRQKIEALQTAKKRAAEIGEQLGYSKRTIERELAQGKVKLRDYEYRYYESYSAEVSQQAHDVKASGKGSQIKLGKDFKFAKAVSELIKKKYSPYCALEIIRQVGEIVIRISLKTLYNYIDKGYIPEITNKSLPNGGRVEKSEYKRVRIALNNTKGTSISERPSEIEKRETFGHWEMDSVEGKQGTATALLVMSERLTRQELIFKISNKTQTEIKRVIDGLEQEMGKERFAKVFKTITCDNGCEFLSPKGIEQSIFEENLKRTKVYYCHPYSAWERGTNENINRMIRRFIPKGKDIGEYTEPEVQEIQDFINSCPRFVLEGYPYNTKYSQYAA